jgi:amicyanin
VRYGFEFTIPLTLRRYFGRRADQAAPDTVAPAAVAMVDTAAVDKQVVETAVPAPPPPQPVVTAPPADSVKPLPVDAPAGTKRVEPKAPTPKLAPARQAPRVRRTTIRNISYMQPKITVPVGTAIEWTNSDPLPHSVTAVDKSFNSGLIQPGKTYRHTFTKAGTYNFYCVPHPFMKGVVVVTEP